MSDTCEDCGRPEYCSELDSRLAALGEKYAQGLLSVAEVATALQISAPDAVARLEECGYVRSAQAAALTWTKRESLFENLRKDRLRRQGKPQSNQSGILRSVAATQRIEGIDARGWLELK